jgi:hypothetical protein
VEVISQAIDILGNDEGGEGDDDDDDDDDDDEDNNDFNILASLKAIISSPHCMSSVRGQWCAMLVGRAIMTASDVLNTCSFNPSINNMDISVFAETYDWIEATLNSMPQFGASDLTPYYTCVVDAIVELLNNQTETGASMRVPMAHTNSSLTSTMKSASASAGPGMNGKGKSNAKDNQKPFFEFAQRVAEAAVNRCPHEDSYWDALESVVRMKGDHKGANHIRWRRSRR